MPELPEVETTVRGIRPHLVNRQIEGFIIRQRRLRWPISDDIDGLAGQAIHDVYRRGKYIIIPVDTGSMLWHLGMSGSMRILANRVKPAAHEHVEMQLSSGQSLRFRDPRRFGSLLFTREDPLDHPLLRNLGPEPLSDHFNIDYLFKVCRKRSASIKSIIMNSHIVVGVGNIYACEALFSAGIRPTREAGSISRKRLARLIENIKQTLQAAIQQGGTTLQDFSRADGKPGYFTQSLQVYGIKTNCHICGKPVKQITQNQRSSYYCSRCQT